ncbi:MAG: hypothetical protein IRZ08_21820, partial [Frankia sp.]|nr:hypothetical protein [Frankia sp.]
VLVAVLGSPSLRGRRRRAASTPASPPGEGGPEPAEPATLAATPEPTGATR